MRGSGDTARLGWVLYASALIIATCGLVYELCAGAMASYLLGNSVTQFSLVIGAYLSAMGLGSYLSRFLERSLLVRFVEIELAVALIGGFESPLLFAGFTYTPAFKPMLYGLVVLIGILVGLEIPLLMRILKEHATLKDLVARVLFLDYIGALVASLLFPLFLVPRLGLLRTSLAFGLLNALVALWATSLFDGAPAIRTRLRVMSVATLALLGAAFVGARVLEQRIEQDLFADPVVMRVTSPYQHIAVTSHDGDTRLFLDGALQFSTVDEYRYHEALVHPAMASATSRDRVLVLGGGDGMAVREVLRWDDVQQVTLVDLDPEITRLFTERPELAKHNAESLSDPRVTVVNADAFSWLRDAERAGAFDVVLIDFPDPNDYGLGKLYTNHFYRLVRRVLADDAVMAMQSTSPFYSPNAYWCIVETVEHEGFTVRPYHAYIPSFGEWGYLLAAADHTPRATAPLPDGLRFLDGDTLPTLFHFPADMARREVPINRLDNQVLVRLYEEDWRSLQGIR